MQYRLAIRVARLYRMVFQVAAMILIKLLPSHLLREYYAKMYDLMRWQSVGEGYRFGRALDSMREQYWVAKSTILFSASELSARPEWMYWPRPHKTFHMIYANRSWLLRFLPISHRKGDHGTVLSLRNFSRNIVRHIIESEAFMEDHYVLIGQIKADLCRRFFVNYRSVHAGEEK